jgi:CPA1 family monovalent cation:H+ antiporter
MLSSAVASFTILLAVALVLSIAAERLRLPPAVVLTGGGAIAGALWHPALPFAFGPALLFAFLPPLIFEAAWTIDARALRRHIAAVAFLAVPGTVVGALAVAAVLAWTGLLPWSSALILGAIVCATDPVAVTAIFRKLNVRPETRTIVEAESIGNDGVAVVLYGVGLTLAAGGGIAWYHAVGHGAIAIVMGTVVGIVCAVPLWLGLATTQASEYEVAGTVALAFASYLIATAFGWSGIFASASAAIALRALLRGRPHMQHLERVAGFWHAAAYMTNAVVFLATGLSISLVRIADAPVLAIVVLATMALVRVVLAIVAVRDRAQSAVVFAAGVRGALPLALALALPATLAHRDVIIDAVFAVVIVTLVLQGGVLRLALARVTS